MQPSPIPPVPEQTAAIARAACPRGAYRSGLLSELPDHSLRRLGARLPRAWQQRQAAARAVGPAA